MTGRRLVEQLLGKNYKVRIIVRSTHKLPTDILGNSNTTTIEASVLDLTDANQLGTSYDVGPWLAGAWAHFGITAEDIGTYS